MSLYRQTLDLCTNPKHTRWLALLLLLGDGLLCFLVIAKVPYTEIDWNAYMQQISMIKAGERNYANIKGDTGPLVYPGAHVWIYRLLYDVTDEGRNVLRAQVIFGGLYLATLALVMSCYRLAKVPPYVFPLLIASKRLHSIFMLRCFNDCWAVFFLWLGIYFYQKRLFTAGSFAFATALGVKMSVLLVLPALVIILVQAVGRERSITQAMIMGQMQVLYGYRFLAENTPSYLSNAFQLSRAFLYKWTVNWRFVPEAIFSSAAFSRSLLVVHLTLLGAFCWFRWLKPTREENQSRSIQESVKLLLSSTEATEDERDRISDRVTPRYVLVTVLTANCIGMLCARSLHYQFYSWLCWSSPVLLWHAGLGPIGVYAVWIAQEWAWNVYPSTDLSSQIVVACLAITVGSVYLVPGNAPQVHKKSAMQKTRLST